MVQISKVPSALTPDMLLALEGNFPLAEVCEILLVSTANVKSQAFGKSEQETGVFKLGETWYVNMERFSVFYLSQIKKNVLRVCGLWSTNEMLSKPGIYYLSQVVAKIPFRSQQLRHQARITKNSRETIGIWKDENGYLVDMQVFSKWIKKIWLEGDD